MVVDDLKLSAWVNLTRRGHLLTWGHLCRNDINWITLKEAIARLLRKSWPSGLESNSQIKAWDLHSLQVWVSYLEKFNSFKHFIVLTHWWEFVLVNYLLIWPLSPQWGWETNDYCSRWLSMRPIVSHYAPKLSKQRLFMALNLFTQSVNKWEQHTLFLISFGCTKQCNS